MLAAAAVARLLLLLCRPSRRSPLPAMPGPTAEQERLMERLIEMATVAKEVGDRAGEGNAYGGLGVAYRSLGDFSQAIEHHRQHLAIGREVPHTPRVGCESGTEREGEGAIL